MSPFSKYKKIMTWYGMHKGLANTYSKIYLSLLWFNQIPINKEESRKVWRYRTKMYFCKEQGSKLHVKTTNRLITGSLFSWPCVTPSQASTEWVGRKILLLYISTNYCLFAVQTARQCTKAQPTPEKSRKNCQHTTDQSASHVISIPNTKSCHNAIKPNLHPPLARPKPCTLICAHCASFRAVKIFVTNFD